jgi:putative SOS response-associated peptidase YedK
MCGRYALYGPHSRYRERFDLQQELDFPPRYNVAPTQPAPIVTVNASGRRIMELARWGLIPYWVKDPDAARKPINAKVETAAASPMFRHALQRHRILVPARGFYEWKQVAGRKQPYLIGMADGDLFGLGGLREFWRGPQGAVVSFTILTTEANELCAPLHNRMPLIVSPENYALWLDPDVTEVDALGAVMAPFPPELMRAYAVGPRVNNAANDDPDLVEPT